ncbi:MAG: hypothetical protein H0W61_14325 [Bacteroidetes bacterium]|nr:hypothetical protein [Bacteroidota bacterium]
MEIKEYETLIISQLDELVGNIINTLPNLNIAVKKGERVGDGISKYLENKFVEFTREHKYFRDSLASPEGKTKNPFDVQTFFEINNWIFSSNIGHPFSFILGQSFSSKIGQSFSF